ncbi:protein cereblon [Patella vulgata]|uniref:protein cereblon n=1 Tax=Patella vulgata TaxID=6465 RepID=UPI00217F4A08|nr:protein cereblon [Patella vulgata]
MAAPMKQNRKQTLTAFVEVFGVVFIIHTLTVLLGVVADEYEGYLLCRACGNEVTQTSELMTVASKLAHRQRNDTLSGSDPVLIQLFKNPQGQFFEVITTKSAEVQKVDKSHEKDSWFPGFDWTIVVCPRCGSHLGWLFQAVHKHSHNSPVSSFYGLVLNNLLHEKEADTIIAVPKVYQS